MKEGISSDLLNVCIREHMLVKLDSKIPQSCHIMLIIFFAKSFEAAVYEHDVTFKGVKSILVHFNQHELKLITAFWCQKEGSILPLNLE